MSHTIAEILTNRTNDYGIPVEEAEEITLNPGVDAVYWFPPRVLRTTLDINLEPPKAPIGELDTAISVNGILTTNQGTDGDDRVAISRQTLRDFYGVASNAEMDRRVYYAFAEHIRGLTDAIDATTGKHLVDGVGLVDNT